MTFILWDTKGDVELNVHAALLHIMNANNRTVKLQNDKIHHRNNAY